MQEQSLARQGHFRVHRFRGRPQERRRAETQDIRIITYDKILETQADQLSRIVIPDLVIPTLRPGEYEGRGLSAPRKNFAERAMPGMGSRAPKKG